MSDIEEIVEDGRDLIREIRELIATREAAANERNKKAEFMRQFVLAYMRGPKIISDQSAVQSAREAWDAIEADAAK